jgi:hypothetical protein
MKLDELAELFRPRHLSRLLFSPVGCIAPVTALCAAITFGAAFGRWGAWLGLLCGFALGVVLVVVWYGVVLGRGFEEREQELAAELTRDAEGPLRRKPPSSGEVDPIPMDGLSGLSPIPIDGPLAEVIDRIDAHAAHDATGALAAAQALRARHPREPSAAILVARSLARAGRPNESVQEAGNALHIAVLRGELDAAADLVVALWTSHEELVLESGVREALAAHFERRGDLRRAAELRAAGVESEG